VSPDEQSDRLRQLEAKIAAAKGAGRDAGPSHNEKGYSQAQLAWRMVTELVAGLGIGLMIGLGLDTLFGTSPVMMVIFIGLGLAAGVRVMMRTAEEVGRSGPGGSGGGGNRGGDTGGAAGGAGPKTDAGPDKGVRRDARPGSGGPGADGKGD
jgi:ATP synthase protein I